jgi:predicted Zn-dependent protease with MMP-like domain
MSKRRRGSHLARPVPGRQARFERLVERALDGIPMPFAAALREVAIVVEDEPSRAQRRENGLGPDDTLYGL